MRLIGSRNDHTQIARLSAPRTDDETTGVLAGVFERILLLRATPFELGHGELIRVLSRLSAVRTPPTGAPPLAARLESLRAELHSARAAAIELDEKWSHVQAGDSHWFQDWVQDADPPIGCPPPTAAAWRAASFGARSRRQMHTALRPWIIRHERPRRRRHHAGSAIEITDRETKSGGLVVPDEIMLPFQLAARAQAVASDDRHGTIRPHFAYGIASSFDAFRRVGSGHVGLDSDLDTADMDLTVAESVPVRALDATMHAADWYRREIDAVLRRGPLSRAEHPKVRATVDRATHLWSRGAEVPDLVLVHRHRECRRGSPGYADRRLHRRHGTPRARSWAADHRRTGPGDTCQNVGPTATQ